MRRPQLLAPADTIKSDAGEAAVLTLGGAAGEQPIIAQISCGYGPSEEAPSGELTIADDRGILYQMPITATGAAPLPFDPPIYGAVDQELVITLSAVDGVVGYLNVTRVA